MCEVPQNATSTLFSFTKESFLTLGAALFLSFSLSVLSCSLNLVEGVVGS